jgi:hypothetical protein
MSTFSPTHEEAAIRTFADELAKAWTGGDLDAFLSCFSTNALVHLATPLGSVVGPSAVAEHYCIMNETGMFGAWAMTIEVADIRALSAAEGVLTGFSILHPPGRPERSKIVWLLVKDDEMVDWSILGCHMLPV